MKRIRKRIRNKVSVSNVSFNIDNSIQKRRDTYNQLITAFLSNNPDLQDKSWIEKKNAFKEHLRERKIFSSSLWKYKSY
jgi:hypothetical protein